MAILFLDYDGVLHPDPVYLRDDTPVLGSPTGSLFMWAPILSEILIDFPRVEIVLSTSWAAHFGLERARSWLPEALQARVVDCVWKKDAYLEHGLTRQRFFALSRYAQVYQYWMRHRAHEWVAIDNDAVGWLKNAAELLVKTDDDTGLSDVAVQEDLRHKLSTLTSPT